MTAKRGDRFTHLSILDPDWEPAPGEKYADAPKATMVVTRTTKESVWFSYADEPGVPRHMDRKTFEERYPFVEDARLFLRNMAQARREGKPLDRHSLAAEAVLALRIAEETGTSIEAELGSAFLSSRLQ